MNQVAVDFDIELPISLDASENEIATTAFTMEAVKVEVCKLLSSGLNDSEVAEAIVEALKYQHHAGWTVDVSILRDDKSSLMLIKIAGHK